MKSIVALSLVLLASACKREEPVAADPPTAPAPAPEPVAPPPPAVDASAPAAPAVDASAAATG